MLDEFGLINMNGRVYDPANARFLSPDPIVHDPFNTQCYNRYSYCFNNPMMYIDPSGYDGYDPQHGTQFGDGIWGPTSRIYADRPTRAQAQGAGGDFFSGGNYKVENYDAFFPGFQDEKNNASEGQTHAENVYNEKISAGYQAENNAKAARSMAELNGRGSGDYSLNLSGNNETDGGGGKPGGETTGSKGDPNDIMSLKIKVVG